MAAWAAAGAVSVGTALGVGRARFAWPLTVLTLVCLLASAIARNRRVAATAGVLLALAGGAGASASWRSAGASDALLPELADRRALVSACGVVRMRRPRSVEIQTDEVVSVQTRWRTREPLRISGEDATRALPGQRICARGPLVPPRPQRNEAPLLAARSLELTQGGSPVRLAAGHVRRSFSAAAQRVLPRTQAGLLLGMTDGDVELLDEETMEIFRTTGLAHLVAVSGSNVAVVLVIVVLITRVLIPRGRWLRAVAAVPPLVFFAFLTGLEASVLRAVFTAGVALAVTAGGRSSDALRIAAFAFVALVLTAPDLLFHPGFQLSFGATLGLILWAGPLSERIGRFLPDSGLGTAAAVAIATTVAAQAAVAPLLAWHFGRLPAVGGIANLIVAPLAPVVMIGGSVTLGLASLVAALDWAPAMMRLPLDVILFCARWFAALPASSIGAGALVGIAVTSVLAAALARDRRMRTAYVALVIVAATAAAGQATARSSFTCTGPAVHALNIGQGTAVLLQSGDHSVLVDTGPARGGVVRQLEQLAVGRVDVVIVSHPHVDHALGALDVLEKLEVGHLIGPVTMSWGAGKDVLRAASEAEVPFTTAAAGDTFSAGGIRIDVLWPEPGPAPAFNEDLVDPYSLVLRAGLGDVDVLLPGDIRAEQQKELVGAGIDVPAMVAVHHGSKNLVPEFVDDVSPALTLVTVGAPNPYGLPAPEAIRTYARHGRVFRTDQDGRVSVCFLQTGAEVVTETR